MKTLYLRAETKKGECRTPLTPLGTKQLVDAGISVWVEASATRAFNDDLYQQAGATVTQRPWTEMGKETVILGLKELPVTDDAITHHHIYFAHAFKGQDEAPQILSRFQRGGGKIFDIEFLVDENQARIAAFGYWAGFVGAGLGLLGYAHYRQADANGVDTVYPKVMPYLDQQAFVTDIQQKLSAVEHKTNVMIMGALGRCGRGANDLLKAVGITNITAWDREEYQQANKPIVEILEHDLFINSVYLKDNIPPMIDIDLLQQNQRLKVISDVSCDPNSTNNPIAVYDAITKMDSPFVTAKGSEHYPVHVQAIDHLPTLLPKESSEEFASALLPHLMAFCQDKELPAVWRRGLDSFEVAMSQH
ncbi:saccharopine dehydrogenase [Vibrio sp. SS-MA-C1-2]|uniref:saccharopine dehydrogenase n=1 Tax=Vibrio sp. SS-MA-C1-2 TaxID=2908646 RepID=UPI001F1FDCB1|nr:saccharopine dehydrogenase [Vibrio sp. SS-MA-C1-2]UJF17972.1 saccharopine dehydrogenase [Vibrio sp. SS-MA-C1-2]